MTSAEASLSMTLAQHVTQRTYASLPATTVHASKRALLDAIGVISAASALAPEARPFIDLAGTFQGAASASILGTGLRTTAQRAALANGAMAHALDYEDAFDGAPVHPNASLIPAVLALAECSPLPVRGTELIAAIAVGCDISCRLALSLQRPLEAGGWYPPPILGAMGAVAGAGRLLGLSPRQMLDAWSLMLLQNSCSGEIIHSADSTIRAVREAFPAQAAVDCARLALAGVRGFSAPFEGRAGFFAMFASGQYSPAELLRDLGAHWHIDSLSFKPWPSCRGTHAAIECALHLHPDVARIERIIVDGGAVQSMLAQPLPRKCAPATPIDAKFSLPWTIALALQYGAVTLQSFEPASLGDPQLRALAGRTSFRLREDWGRQRATSGALEIHLAGGEALYHTVEDPLGSPARPLDDARLTEKFLDCLSRSARPPMPAQARNLAHSLMGVEGETDVRPLLARI
ncbi:MAG: MmgE/PrpD family protein [Pseudomonadota bacterium]